MSKKNLSPANVIPHVVRKIRLLGRAIKQGNDLNESGYICSDWQVVKTLIHAEIGHYERQLEYWRDEYPQVVAYFEELPRRDGFSPESDPYANGKWVFKHGSYTTHYTGLVIRWRYNRPFMEDEDELDDIPF